MERLEELLRERRMTKADLARAMGVTPQVIGCYFQSRHIRPTTLAAILRALKFTEVQIQDARIGEFYDITPETSGNHTGEKTA